MRIQYNFTHDIAGLSGNVAVASPRWLRLTRSGDLEARVFLLQPGGKATRILSIEGDGFGRQIWAQVELFLPGSDLIST